MPSLADIRQTLTTDPPFVGQIFTTGAQASPPDGSYIGKATGDNAKRIIASSDLTDIGRQASITDTASDFFQGGYIYVQDSGEQRRITDNGYTDSVDAQDILDGGTTTQVGYFIVGRDLGSILQAGTTVEYHSHPVITVDRLPGWHTLINRALKAMRVVKRIQFTGNGGNRYTAPSWVTEWRQVGPAWSDEGVADTEPLGLPGGITPRWDGETLYLITGYGQSVGTTFSVDFYRRAHTWIKVGGTWGDSTVGLVNETDEAAVPLEEVVKVARYHALKALSRYSPVDTDRAAYNNDAQDALDAALPYMKFDQPEHLGAVVSDAPLTKADMLFRGSGRRSWP